jgi:hypothetical protein
MGSPTVPKYSWEILVVQAVAMIACIVFLFLDEYRLYVYLVLPLMISYAIQYYRLRRARKRMYQETIQILQAIAEHQNRELTLYEPQHTIDDAFKDLREEIERHRIAKDEV